MKIDSLLTQTQKLLRRHNLRARKGLGQHFLVDEGVLETIIATAQLTTDDVVVEVGPGLGVLTRELAKHAERVVAIEIDDKLAAILRDSLKEIRNVTIINQDVLKIDPPALLKELKAESPDKYGMPYDNRHYKLVANLPYYITSPVLRHFLETTAKPELMVVMVQKEVAEEIAAKPGRMSLLSIGIQLYGAPEIVARVPAESFYPAPAVDSSVLKVTPYSHPPVEISDREGFFELARAGFSAARKQLANSLANGLGVSKEETLALLAKAEIDPQRRAETLSLEEWARLWRVYQGKG
ncbi:MAG: 16S rRNA (adenine(1518)-N(6)/adenine(1519)-N(6))-dimethyltransferase RsmA [Chloroflexi bacterium]|nr:16S rRNA (adenine(1518)-N(6)/adenine(1519)-N(6))-dimethyltransferase RsmA [Chloroflexota bacterium]